MSAEFVDINLLPGQVRPALGGAVWRRLMIPGFLLLLVAVVLVAAIVLLKMRNDRALAEQRAQMNAVSEDVRDFSAIMAEVELLQQQITMLATQAEQLEAEAEQLERTNASLSPFLRALTDSLLPRMTITGVVAETTVVYVVQGEAGSYSLVTEYASNLEERPEVREVTLRSIDQLSDEALPGAVRWTVEVERQ